MRHREDNTLPFIFSYIVPLIAIGLFFWVIFITLSYHESPEPELINLNNWQNADAAFGLPIGELDSGVHQSFEPHFHLLSVWERAITPRADYLIYPIGSETGALSYNAQPFNSPNPARGGNHSGDDLNGIGGKNSDFGDPVFSIGDGLVVYTGTPSPGWGKCIVIAHYMTDGRQIHSMYGHLATSEIPYLSTVSRGQKIGTIGSAEGHYWAHLHLEIRESDGVSPFLSGYPTGTQYDRLPPEATLRHYLPSPELSCAPAVLTLMQKYRKLPELQMDEKSRNIFYKLQQGWEKRKKQRK